MDRIASFLISTEVVLTKINMVIAMACGILWLLFMFLVVGDVTGRYAFLMPIEGTLEIGQNVLAVAVFLSWAAILAKNQHLRIFIVLDRLPPRWRFLFEVLAPVLGIAVILPIAWYGFSFAAESLRIKETGITYGIPLFPGKLALFLGTSLFALQFFIQLLVLLFSRPARMTIVAEEQNLAEEQN